MDKHGPICANGGLNLDSCLYWYLFNEISDGVFIFEWTTDKLPGVIIEVNKSACLMLGYEREELLLRDSSEYCPIRETCGEASFLNALFTGNSVEFEINLAKKNGEVFVAEVAINRMYAHGKEAIIAVVRDVTRKKALEMEMKREESIAVAMATAGAICHEMNQPLQALVGYIDMLSGSLKGKGSPDFSKENGWVAHITAQLCRLKETINRLNGITSFEEIDYIGNTKIMDIMASSLKKG